MKVSQNTQDINCFYLNDEFKSIGTLRSIKKGQTLYSKGEAQGGFFYILSGLMGLVDIAPNGSESLLRVFGQNYFTAYRSFLSGEVCNATSTALTDVNYLFFEFSDPLELLKKYPSVYVHLTKTLCHDLKIAEERLNDLTGKRVINRIIEAIIFLKNKDPHYIWTRREIGEFCSATTETVTRAFSKLEKLNLIKKDGRDILIIDVEKLLSYSYELESQV